MRGFGKVGRRRLTLTREPLHSRDNMVMEPFGFLFASHILDLELREPGSQTPSGADKNNLHESLLSSAKGPGKRQPCKMENF